MAAVLEPAAAGHPVRLAVHAMATRFELVLAGGDPVRLRAIGEEALAEIEACEAALSPFRPGSQIARVNREAYERPVPVDPDTFALLVACARLHRASGGAFDPSVGPLLVALGFRGAGAGDAAACAAAHAAVGWDGVELDPGWGTVRFLRPGMALDLGAIGKGHALDLAGAVLRRHGVAAALLHAGTSSVLALGAPPDRDAWRVTLGRAPMAPRIRLRDAALGVSAPQGRVVHGIHGVDLHHLLDPERGTSAANGVVCAAVTCPSARDADAWSTALAVRGCALALPAAAAGVVALRSDSGAVRWHELGDPAPWLEIPSMSTSPAAP